MLPLAVSAKSKAIRIGPDLILRPHVVAVDLLRIHGPQLQPCGSGPGFPRYGVVAVVLLEQALLILAPFVGQLRPLGWRAILFAGAENLVEHLVDECVIRLDGLAVGPAAQCGPHEEQDVVAGGVGRRMGAVEVEIRRARSVQAVRHHVAYGGKSDRVPRPVSSLTLRRSPSYSPGSSSPDRASWQTPACPRGSET